MRQVVVWFGVWQEVDFVCISVWNVIRCRLKAVYYSEMEICIKYLSLLSLVYTYCR